MPQLKDKPAVWGPGPFNLGYKGAPLATAISYNLVAIASIMYGFIIPKTAWHPWSKRCFTGLGALAQLSLSGVGLFFHLQADFDKFSDTCRLLPRSNR